MTCNNPLPSLKQSARFRRVCAFAMLVFVAFGAIAGAAHNHGNFGPQSSAKNTGLKCSDLGDGGTSSRQIPNGGECLVCQLHRNLYSGLLSASPQIAAPVTQFAFVAKTQPGVISQTNTPQRGRAPPTSLS